MSTEANPASGASEVGGIPIRNIWLLMLYASELFRQIDRTDTISVEQNPDEIADLVAELLTHAVEQRLRRNLTYGYTDEHAIVNRVRGKIDVLETASHRLLSRGAVACDFQRMTVDTPRNQYVCAALKSIARLVQRRSLATRCRTQALALDRLGVSNRKPSRADVSMIRFGRHDRDDRLMVAAAMLAFDLALPTELPGGVASRAPERLPVWLRDLFEKAVGGFCRVALADRGWKTETGKYLKWPMGAQTRGVDSIMPAMQTDIVLENREAARRIIVDTKFTSVFTSTRFRDRVLQSGYLYQMYTYVRSQTGQGDPLADRAEGVLLHPVVDERVDEAASIQGHIIRFLCVDLAATTRTIREQLLAITEHPELMATTPASQ